MSFILGLCATLALPPISLLPAIIPAFSLLLWQIITSTSKREAFFTGWWFGFGHFVTNIYWIAISLFTDLDHYAWMVPFAVLGIPAVLALYIGGVSLITYLVPIRQTWGKLIVFAISWVSVEMLRGQLLTGFPWNLAGYVWTSSIEIMQLAAFTGIWGLSLLTILTGAVFSTLIAPPMHNGQARTGNLKPVAVLVALTTLIWVGGHARLPDSKNYPPTSVSLRIIQANIPPNREWQPEYRLDTLMRHVALSREKLSAPVQLLIWPESAIPYSLDAESSLLPLLRKVVPPGGVLLAGAMRESGSGATYRLWNSLFAINANGAIASYYDKAHLVPFGEYIPLRNYLPIDKITYGATDFSAGAGAVTLSPIRNLPSLSPLICYEAIFPTGIIAPNGRPSWLLNITNDAWFGKSSGPYQHFQMARMRSVEQGLPLVRAANTGISGVIDAYGRITVSSDLGQISTIDSRLPAPIPQTIYGYYGNYIIMLILYALGLFLFLTQPSYNSND